MKLLLLFPISTIATINIIAPAIAELPNTSEKLNIQLDKPVVELPDTTNQTIPNPTVEPKILVAELIVKGVTGDLEDEIYRVIQTRPGTTATRSQLQDDIQRIIKTGRFAQAQSIPEDTPLGVRITFIVTANPVLKKVEISGSKIIPESVINQAFRSQYGQPLDRRTFQTGIQTLNEWYKDKGYILAQIVDSSKITDNGVATIEVAEGEIEDIQIQFITMDGTDKDAKGNPIKGRTRDFIITREMETKAGDVVNRDRIQADLQRIAGLRIFKDLKLNFAHGKDPRKVILVIQPVEQSNINLNPGVNWSSRTGISAIGSIQAGNIGGNNQKLNAEVEAGDRNLAFDFSFTDPWIAGDRFRTSYTARLFRQQSTSLNFEGGKTDIKLANGDRPRILRTGAALNFTRPL